MLCFLFDFLILFPLIDTNAEKQMCSGVKSVRSFPLNSSEVLKLQKMKMQ